MRQRSPAHPRLRRSARSGARSAAFFFFGTTLVAAIGAGLLFHLIYPEISDRPIVVRAWGKSWCGGNAGSFGLIGALSTRSLWPGRLLSLFVAWEVFILAAYLRNYTTVFHLIAPAAGCLGARFLTRSGRRGTRREALPAVT